MTISIIEVQALRLMAISIIHLKLHMNYTQQIIFTGLLIMLRGYHPAGINQNPYLEGDEKTYDAEIYHDVTTGVRWYTDNIKVINFPVLLGA
jgi:hypothetical protein